MAHAKTLWHGRYICSHMVPKMNSWETKTTGYSVRLIQGSYSSYDLSAGTHARGGAADSEGDGRSALTLKVASNLARSCILVAWPRFWSGNWHIHLLDPSCSDLSSAARAQVLLFGRGFDGLVGNHPDPGSRYYAKAIMAAYWKAH
ncbi:MAG TPA: hypothetical protein VIT65_20535 [Microlunatus sp.]